MSITLAYCEDPEPHGYHDWRPEPQVIHDLKRCPGKERKMNHPVHYEHCSTCLIIKMLANLLDNEPPQDAGGHPSMEVHERVGAEWAEWDKKVHGLKLILAPRLIDEALEIHRKGKKDEPDL